VFLRVSGRRRLQSQSSITTRVADHRRSASGQSPVDRSDAILRVAGRISCGSLAAVQWQSWGRETAMLQFRMILIWSYSSGIESIRVGKAVAIRLRTCCVRSRGIAASASKPFARSYSPTMMPIAVTYSASSPCDGKAAADRGWDCKAAVYSASKLQLAKRVTAAMRGAAFADMYDVIRHAGTRRSMPDFDGALHVRVERRRSGETETAPWAGSIEILSATGPRYNLV